MGSRFILTYPVSMIVRPGTDQILGGSVTGGGQFAAIFTDEDLEERFAVALGFKTKLDSFCFESGENLVGALRSLRDSGYTHVAVDPAGERIGEEARLIDEVIRDVEAG